MKKNKWGKTAAVVLALTLMGIGWSYYDGTRKTTLALTVEFIRLPLDHVVVGGQPKIDVIIEGPARLVQNLKSPLVYKIDLTGVETGRHLVALSPEKIPLIQGAKILAVNPTSFLIHVDTKSEKTVPIVPDLVNDPVSGFVLTSVEMQPTAVTLIGPASILEKLSTLRTTPVDLSGMTAPTKKTVALNLQEGLCLVHAENTLVQLVLDVREKVIERTISVPVQCVGTGHSFTIHPACITLLIRGPQNTLGKISQGTGIHVSVNLSGLAPGKYIRPAVIEPPLNTIILKMEPTVFSIELLESSKIGGPLTNEANRKPDLEPNRYCE